MACLSLLPSVNASFARRNTDLGTTSLPCLQSLGVYLATGHVEASLAATYNADGCESYSQRLVRLETSKVPRVHFQVTYPYIVLLPGLKGHID